MQQPEVWKQLGWKHPVWELVRYYRSVRGEKQKATLLKVLKEEHGLAIEDKILPISEDVVSSFFEYISITEKLYTTAVENLRTEEEALNYCISQNFKVGTTSTKSGDHHQSSKSMIACVSSIAIKFCEEHGLTVNSDPQNRCVWFDKNSLHVTSRNLDGAIPSLTNPIIAWEIKEYWGKTKGGSKMSDAVYECQLVGKELREFEDHSNIKILHVVFLDGKEQWSHRKSDLRRFIDLLYQGLIDHLIFGKEVETEWQKILGSTKF